MPGYREVGVPWEVAKQVFRPIGEVPEAGQFVDVDARAIV